MTHGSNPSWNTQSSLAVNVAVTERAADIDTVQPPEPEQPLPLQPLNRLPLAALADSVTVVPLLKFALHVPPQLIPAGDELTMPEPLPARLTVSV